MIRALVLGLSMCIAGVASAQCAKPDSTHGHIQRMSPADLTSPDGDWELVVHPNYAQTTDDDTPVLLRACHGPGSWSLFGFGRTAETYWGEAGHQLLILNQPSVEAYYILLFDTKAVSSGSVHVPADSVDRLVRQIVAAHLGAAREIVFYIPDFISWTENSLALSVSGWTVVEGSGPGTPYCYGFVINTDSARVRRVLSRSELGQANRRFPFERIAVPAEEMRARRSGPLARAS